MSATFRFVALYSRTRALRIVALACALLPLRVASAAPDPKAAGLGVTSATIQSLVQTVGRSVVQVVVNGYRPDTDAGAGMVLVRARTIGSGVVIATGGYVVTNAHVVSGAQRIDVVLPDIDGEVAPLGHTTAKTAKARLVGLAPELDLALLQVDIDLPAVVMAPDAAVHQGELVFAFGSPDGLRNSVSMGIVSAVARQVDPSSAIAYIQTDSAINPGNSGGPLVNTEGQLVGLNTFIQSRSGGSEGLGFALPVSVLGIAYPQLRDYGHIHRGFMGMALQRVTRTVKDGLQLEDESGLLVADVAPDGPAFRVGVQPGDVIRAIDGRAIESLSFEQLYRYWYGLPVGQHVALAVWRGGAVHDVSLETAIAPHVCERPSTEGFGDAVVESLGIFAQATNAPDAGVLVTARLSAAQAPDIDLATGDVIRAVNLVRVTSLPALRETLAAIAPGRGVVLQVERDGSLRYVDFEK